MSNTPKVFLSVLALSAVGLILNYFNLSFFYNIDFLFGGFAVMLVAMRYGAMPAFISAVVAYSVTYLHWNHPFAIPYYALEAAFVGWRYSRHRGNLIIHDLLYWFLPGAAISIGIFIGLIGFSTETAVIIWLKSLVNGAICTLFVSVAFHGYQYIRFYLKHPYRAISLKNLLFEVIAAAVLLPAVVTLIYLFHEQRHETEELYRKKMEITAEAVIAAIRQWVDDEALISLTLPMLEKAGPHLTILDSKGIVQKSSFDAFAKGMDLRKLLLSGEIIELPEGISIWLPDKHSYRAHRLRWEQAFYFREIALFGRNIFIQTPFKVVITELNRKAFVLLSAMTGLLILTVGAAFFLSRYIASTVAELSKKTTHLPQQVEQGLDIHFEPSFIREIDQLVKNFKDVIGNIRDYTRQIQGQKNLLEDQVIERTKSLQESERKYRSLTENMQDLIYRVQLRPKIVLEFVNSQVEAITGYHPEDFYRDQRLILRLIHPEDRGNLRRLLIGQGLKDKTVSIRWSSKSGKEITIEHANTYIYDERGRVIAMEGVGRDVTGRRVLAELFMESARRFKVLFDNSPDAIFLTDIQTGTIIDVNIAAESLMGTDRSRLIGRHFKELHPPDLAKEAEKAFNLQAAGKAKYVEIEIIRSNGSRVPVDIITNTTEIRGKRVLCSVFRDITERKQAEVALKAALEEKNLLIREVHHRVKNNMQVIMSLINIKCGALQGGQSSERDVLFELKQRIKAMSLVHESLYLSENLSHINIKNYIGSLLGQLVVSYGRRDIKIEQSVDDIEIRFENVIHLGLIINELVNNAYKYAFPDQRGGVIKVQVNRMDNDRCRLMVSDNGIGMSTAIDFNSIKSLGMQLVYLIVSQLEGTINITNKGGTTVSIEFPLPFSGRAEALTNGRQFG